MIAATARIIAADGPAAATVGAVGQALGASSGSIYHRFKTRNELLGRVWLSTAAEFQSRFVKALGASDPRQSAIDAALMVPRWVREDPVGASILLTHRREDFLSSDWPAAMTADAQMLATQLNTALQDITHRLFGRSSAPRVRAVTFALVDMPYAAVRHYIARKETPPSDVDTLLRAACEAALDSAGAPGPGFDAARKA
ncbi:TetR/AcrR family transcriptional regulator [Dyella tabacisoli]|uniref:TetR/AcrR family transcriptional regulator n=1 Tax=Dyella tabacisoli TaxID=2282381 RepID=UPI0013B39B5E|nr:TetR/AcrR family transcriptional regulator [Dyella tabacisoli]